MKEGHKLGSIPNGWEVKKVGDFAEFVGSGVTPKGGQSVYKTRGIPFIRSQNVYPEGLRLEDVAYIDEDQNNKMIRTEFKDYDVLLNITGASIGRCTYVPQGFGRGNVNQHVCIIRTDETVLPQYLSLYINSSFVQKQIEASNTGSSREGLNFQQVRKLNICLPKIDEQMSITNILSTVDEQIGNTESIIEKTKELKKGLMQKLFTKGINHTEFKESEAGVIPKEWAIKSLKSISSNITIGLVKTMTKYYVGEGVPLIRNSDIKENKILKDTMMFLDADFSSQNKDKTLKKGDIVTVHTGDIGTSAVIEKELVGAQGFATLNTTVNKNIINEYYLCWYFNSDIFKKQAYSFSTGDGRNNLNLKDFINTLIIVPNSIEEQEKIVSILSSVSAQIDNYENRKQKLQELKQALMQKLLTGKIRVKV